MPRYTYDSWDYKISDGLDNRANVAASFREAIEYIDSFYQIAGEGFLYVPVYNTIVCFQKLKERYKHLPPPTDIFK
jgi:hypothetical protein